MRLKFEAVPVCPQNKEEREVSVSFSGFAAPTLAATQSSMALDMKARSKNINLIVRCHDSWLQAGGSDADRVGESIRCGKILFLVGTPRPDARRLCRSIGEKE